jgi:hypothetical protein
MRVAGTTFSAAMKSSTSCLDSATPGDSARATATLAEMAARKQAPTADERDERLKIELDPESALRGLLAVEPDDEHCPKTWEGKRCLLKAGHFDVCKYSL